MSLRRVATMGAIVALTIVSGASLPGSSAYLNGSSGTPSSFGVGELQPEGSLVDVAYGALCGVQGQQECPRPVVEFVPPWLSPQAPALAEPAAPAESPAPAPDPAHSESPEASPRPEPSALPSPGERCESADCMQEAVVVVGAFAEELRELHEREPGGVPEEAVRTIAEFAEELRHMPETPDEDVALPQETVDALGALVEAGVLEAFIPECVMNVGQLAALLTDRQAAAESGDPTPEPSPTATCEPQPHAADGPAPEPSPEPNPSPQTEPQPATEPEPAPSGEPTEYPYDGPGHRVRSA